MYIMWFNNLVLFFFQAEDGIRYLVRSRGLGDVYKRQVLGDLLIVEDAALPVALHPEEVRGPPHHTLPVPGLSLIHI